MGQKINPIGLPRHQPDLGFALVFEQERIRQAVARGHKIRESLTKSLKQAAISKIVIERPHKKARINIHSAPPHGDRQEGDNIEKLRKQVAKLTNSEVAINIVEVRKPEIDATLVAKSIAQQLERRVAFRRAMERAVQSAMRLGAEGIRINCSGRLGGAEIARLNGIARAACRCTPCAPTSTTASPPRTPRMAPAGSRSGYSRAKSSSTIRSPRTSGWPRPTTRRPIVRAANRASAKPSRSGSMSASAKVHDHDAAKENQVPQSLQGPHSRQCEGRVCAQFRRVRAQGDGAGACHRASDRGRPPRADPAYEARRPCLDPCFPDVPVSKKPIEVRMGKGKGAPEFWSRVAPGRIMFEVDGVPRASRARRSPSLRRSCRSRRASFSASRNRGRFSHENASRLSDIRVMTKDQLSDEALKLKKERFNLRFQKASGQLQDTARVRVVRRDIARVMTVAAQKRAAARPRTKHYAEENFAGRRGQRQAGKDARGEGRAPVHPPAAEEDRAPVEELPRACRKQDPEGRRHVSIEETRPISKLKRWIIVGETAPKA